MRFLHVSDLHLHADPDAPEDLVVRSRLNRLADAHFAQGEDCYLIVTGDLTHDGAEEQYENALEALGRFPRDRVLLVPGNHDVGYRGVLYSDRCARRFDDLACEFGYREAYLPKRPIVRVLEANSGLRVATIGVNAVLETVSPHDLSMGEVGEAQVAELDDILGSPDIAAMPKLVYLHFHPFDAGFGLALVDAAEFVQLLNRHRVEAVCFGHRHGEGQWSGAGKGLPDVAWFVEANALRGTASALELTFSPGGMRLATRPIHSDVMWEPGELPVGVCAAV